MNPLCLTLALGLFKHVIKKLAFKHLLKCDLEVRFSVESLVVLPIYSALGLQIADDLI